MKENIKKQSAQKRLFEETSSEDEAAVISLHSTDDEIDVEEDECVECLELYSETASKSDWIKCVRCSRWLDESCTLYENLCCLCGRFQNRLEKRKSKIL